MLNTGPHMQYGFAPEGEGMRYASRRKTVSDAVLVINRGKQIVAWHAPGNTQDERDANIARLRADVEAAQ
jgi:hypothetical protein